MEQNSTINPIPSQGPVVGIIVVIIVVIIGAFYFFSRLSAMNVVEPVPVTATSEASSFAPTSTSTDTAAIEEDLDAESFDSIDAEMQGLDAEFGN
jgi:hypothetical protein